MNTVIVNDNQGTTEKELRQANARDGETIGDTRPMAGQSPYLINAYVNYLIPTIDLNVNVAYNVQGPTLTVVGSGVVPDVYSVPFDGLSFNVYKGFGARLRSRVTLGVDNILGEARTQVYKSYEAEDQIYTTFNPGTRVSLKYTFTL